MAQRVAPQARGEDPSADRAVDLRERDPQRPNVHRLRRRDGQQRAGSEERGERGSCRSRSRMRVLGNVDHRLRPLDGGGARVFLGRHGARGARVGGLVGVARGDARGRFRSRVGIDGGPHPRTQPPRRPCYPPGRFASPRPPHRCQPGGVQSRRRGHRRVFHGRGGDGAEDHRAIAQVYAGQRALRSVVQITGALGHLSVVQVDEGGRRRA
mmetsp:Transcript_1509/g.5938  ORF Transcript_1509/g.5938 Transcript_1509/m.5938 type:complete len:211 (-) Transcript_1509:2581-3213(-)